MQIDIYAVAIIAITGLTALLDCCYSLLRSLNSIYCSRLDCIKILKRTRIVEVLILIVVRTTAHDILETT